ncbi:MAG: cytochrome c [Planctomycetes bacterium]|nr:cytochrome c [Planctomycetota bacterium]
MKISTLLSALLMAGTAFSSQDPLADLPEDLKAAHVTFVELCASCHGVLGDGKGTTELDRPARSFADGGFSFGNTKEALFRTLKSGIPGTPMPAFGGQVPDERLEELARLVQFLGPGGEPEPPKGTELIVKDRPLIVRGHFPALDGEEDDVVRGLLIGDPSGMSFQYASDNLRLLSVRLGGFVDRADWGGRGGSPLRPLGRSIYTPRDLLRPTAWRLANEGYLRPRLRATSTTRGVAKIEYELFDAAGVLVARCVEAPRMLSTSLGSGYAVSYQLTAGATRALTFYPYPSPTSQSWTLNHGGAEFTGSLTTGHVSCKRPMESPGNELRIMTPLPGMSAVERGFEMIVSPEEPVLFEAGVLFLTEWSDENAVRALKELQHGNK